MGEGACAEEDEGDASVESVAILEVDRRRGCAVSMVRGCSGRSRDWVALDDRILREVRRSANEEAAVGGAVMERARAISTGALEVYRTGRVDERLRSW
jgi:hypothetical protein